MAVFRIIASRPQRLKSFSGHPEFDIELISGTLSAGITFRLYETHHPCDFTILEVHGEGQRLALIVDKSVSWEDQWVGATVDTNDPKASLKYGYEV